MKRGPYSHGKILSYWMKNVAVWVVCHYPLNWLSMLFMSAPRD
jgi:hypothetical protein